MKKTVLLLLLCASLLLPACTAQTEPETPQPEIIQPEQDAQPTRTWQDIQAELPDVSAMSAFPTAEEV